MICFGQQQRSLKVFRYLGPCLSHLPKDASEIFSSFFELAYEQVITSDNEYICKDFCMFTKQQDKLILASAIATSSPSSNDFPHSLHSINSLDDITFWIIDIQTGRVTGKKTFKRDYIFLTNHAGVHLFDDYLAIASVQHQSIYLCLIRVRHFF